MAKKYIDADLLRKKIERLDESNTVDLNNGCNDDQCYGYYLALSDLINFLDSLQQEQPEADLEKEMNKLISLEYVNQRDDEWEMCIARHFYEFGKNAK